MKNSCFVTFLLLTLASCATRQKENPTPTESYDTTLISGLRNEMKYILKSETQQVDLTLSLENIESDSLVTLGELAKQNGVLFFYFSRYQCGECIDRELEFIMELYPVDAVIIIGKEKTKRNLKILQKNKKIKHPIYWMRTENVFNVSWDALNKPVFFKINSKSNPYNIYSPKFSYPQFSEEYHKSMLNLINSQ